MYKCPLKSLMKLGIEAEWEVRLELNSYGFRLGMLKNLIVEFFLDTKIL